MTMKIELRSVNDDWEELLIDEKLMLEGHSLQVCNVIELVKSPDAQFTQTHINRCIYCDTVLAEDVSDFKCAPRCPHD